MRIVDQLPTPFTLLRGSGDGGKPGELGGFARGEGDMRGVLAVALSGLAVAAGSVSGALSVSAVGAVALAGSMAGDGQASGSLSAGQAPGVALAGSASALGSAAGGLTFSSVAPLALAGSASAAGSPAGSLSVVAPSAVSLAGSPVGGAQMTGFLAAGAVTAMAGTAYGEGSQTGALTVAAPSAPVISITSGSGWAGSTYSVANASEGKWQADETDISGATAGTYVMPLANEGKGLSFLRSDGVRSNVIEMWVKSDIASFIDRFDARSGVTLTSTRVARWLGVKGVLAAAQDNSAQQPTFSATARNGLPGLLFDRGPRSNLRFENPGLLSAAKGGRMDVDFFITPTMNTYLVALGVGVDSQRWEFNLGGTSQLGIYTMATGDLNQSAPVNEDYIFTANVDVKAGATSSVQINNLDPVTKVAGSNDAGDNSVAYIGARNPGFDYGLWHGVIQALSFFSQPRTADEIMRCRAYDAHSFGRPDLLAASNPYKASPPRIR